MPTKSGIAGICCAALGLSRGSEKEKEFLGQFAAVQMTSIATPRKPIKKELPIRRLQDYHTVQYTKRAIGSINNDCVLTHRQYLTDASFGVLLEGLKSLLKEIADALIDPVWGIWLGRKTCIPSAPVLVGMGINREEILKLLIEDYPIEYFTRQEEAEHFAEGRDTIPDSPMSFAIERTQHCSPRRVRTIQGTRRS